MEPMPLIFSTNWNNKLECRAFTTLRLYNARKHIPGAQVRIMLKAHEVGRGTIAEVKTLRIEQINNYIAYLDTGYNAQECKDILRRMYSTVNWHSTMLALILVVKDKG